MDTPSDNSERPPAEYKRGACWDIERAKSAYAHYKAYDDKVYCLHKECRVVKSLNRDQFGKKPKTIARFKCGVCKQNVYIKNYLREYMSKSIIPEEVEGTKETKENISSQSSVSVSQTQGPYIKESNDDMDDYQKIDKLLAETIKPPKNPQSTEEQTSTRLPDYKHPSLFGITNKKTGINRIV
ncbi:hypothetical protein BB560_004113 [Smittium megazygosporum]|uniref:Uncharacterized protein n=1 Tax=Smittium megazygosporum TaxID=133381 RepID=A0A2T9ZAA9_9FUNG|nr:hypothetical protein BB560_004113 [Smittium megazygosporum]